jgi:hypothetical protein
VYDYRVAETLPESSATRRSHRGAIANAPPGADWRYVERIEIRDLAQYQKDLGPPAGRELLSQRYDDYCNRSKTIDFTTTPLEQ